MTSSAEPRPERPTTTKRSEPDDPMELRGEEVRGDLVIMVRCMVEELLLLGHPPARILTMAASAEFQALFAARRRLGAERMDALVADAARRIGVHHHRTSELPASPAQPLVTLGGRDDA